MTLNANPANIKQLFGPENLPGRSINRLQERSFDIRTYARTYVCSLCMDSCYIFYKKKNYHLIGMTDAFFFFCTSWCLCVKISFILLLFNNSVGVTGLFFYRKQSTDCTLPTTLEIGKIKNYCILIYVYQFTKNVLRKMLEVAFPRECLQTLLGWVGVQSLARANIPFQNSSHATPLKVY